MSRTRGEANSALYRARILLEAWDTMRSGSTHTSTALLEGFLPAVRLHLMDAYGWFLLSVAGVEESSQIAVPRSTRDLPPTAPGKSPAPELGEFAQLERDGWLSQMLKDYRQDKNEDNRPRAPGQGSSGLQNLLVSDRQPPGYAVAQAWADSLEAIMARMDDSLTEC
ncbi:MAG: hypothetical protein NWP69_07910 [Congregibacter sp.]|nr:hypothetical protein [Congregibacter sp.]MDP5070078.1 hypothetical protein [Congregibacter sp.]